MIAGFLKSESWVWISGPLIGSSIVLTLLKMTYCPVNDIVFSMGLFCFRARLYLFHYFLTQNAEFISCGLRRLQDKCCKMYPMYSLCNKLWLWTSNLCCHYLKCKNNNNNNNNNNKKGNKERKKRNLSFPLYHCISLLLWWPSEFRSPCLLSFGVVQCML